MRLKYLIGIVFCLVGCNEEEPGRILDPILESYFDQFIEEGSLRGIDISNQMGMIGGILDDLEEGVRGQCQHLSDDSDRVVIDRNYWNQASSEEREFLVFHELGHCALNRSHLDEESPQGVCASIMHANSSSCRNTYGASTREHFLDELFSH